VPTAGVVASIVEPEGHESQVGSVCLGHVPIVRHRSAGRGRRVTTRHGFVPVLSVAVDRLHHVSLVRSKQRVIDHGEVFTPAWLVEAMLDLVRDESERIDARFLEPACGSGNFLVPVLRRKLAAVEFKFGKSDFERRNYALFGLMCIYGVELLPDNVAECRQNLLDVFAEYLQLTPGDELYAAARTVLEINIVHGDARSMETLTSPIGPITFAEWGYLGKGKFQRRDFRFDTLTNSAAFGGALHPPNDAPPSRTGVSSGLIVVAFVSEVLCFVQFAIAAGHPVIALEPIMLHLPAVASPAPAPSAPGDVSGGGSRATPVVG
jgi:hypothetical protein